jgi:hypothetical protein
MGAAFGGLLAAFRLLSELKNPCERNFVTFRKSSKWTDFSKKVVNIGSKSFHKSSAKKIT